MKWIDIRYEFPKKDGEYLVIMLWELEDKSFKAGVTTWNVYEGLFFLSDEKLGWIKANHGHKSKVTHWMEKPSMTKKQLDVIHNYYV